MSDEQPSEESAGEQSGISVVDGSGHVQFESADRPQQSSETDHSVFEHNESAVTSIEQQGLTERGGSSSQDLFCGGNPESLDVPEQSMEDELMRKTDDSQEFVHDSDQSFASNTSSPLKKVSLDDSDDSDTDSEDDIRRTMGLTYSDHNYDVADPTKRYRKPEDDDTFPKIGGLNLGYEDCGIDLASRGSYGDGMQRQTRPVFRTSDAGYAGYPPPMAGRSRNDSSSYSSNPPKGFVTVRSDILPAYMNTYGTGGSPRRMNTSAVVTNNVSSGGASQLKRIPQARQPSVGTPIRAIGRFSTMTSSPGAQVQQPTQSYQLNEGTSSSMPTLHAAPKVDQPPHRLLDSSHRIAAPDAVPLRDRIPPQAQHQQHGRPSYSAADPSQAALANAPAPLIVPCRGSRPLMRGRGGSQSNRGKKDDIGAQSDDGANQAAHLQSSSRSVSSSPRKQVHFSDSYDGCVQDDGMLEQGSDGGVSPPRAQGHIAPSPASLPPHRAMAPLPRSPPKLPMLPPHRVLQVNSPALNTPSRVPLAPPPTRAYVAPEPNNVAMPTVAQCPQPSQHHQYIRQPIVDPHSMPDNIIDDGPSQEPEPSPRKSLKDTSLPPEVAALALALAPPQSAVPPQEFNEERIKAKIAEIRQELEQEQVQMERGQLKQNLPSTVSDDSGPRGRGRPKGTGRPRNSLSNSSSTFGSPVHPPLLSPGSPPKGSPAQFHQHPSGSSPSRAPRFIGMGNRPPGSSPVRTNLDFNNHLTSGGSPSVGLNLNHTPRVVYPIPAPSSGKVTTNVAPTSSAKDKKKSPIRGRKSKVIETPVSPLYESDETESSAISDEEEAEGNWETKCICGYEFNTEWMTACDKCNAWIHNECYGMPSDASMANASFICYNCNPNQKLVKTKEEARAIQKKFITEERKKDRRTKIAKAKSRLSGSNTTRASIKLPLKSTLGRKSMDTHTGKNTYTKRARAMVNLYESEQADRRQTYVAPSEPNFKRMFVAKGTEGLVSGSPMPPGTVVMEYVGNVCCPDECGRDLDGSYQPFCILYDGLAPADVPPSRQRDAHLCIDARKISGDSRCIRRSCRPNSMLRHTIANGVLSIWVVTKEFVPGKTEITIPFDCDYRAAMNKLHCECAGTNDKDSDECLILSDPLAIQLGHREHPYMPKKEGSLKSEDLIAEKRGRRSKAGKASAPARELHAEPENELTKPPRDEKSEEESVPARSANTSPKPEPEDVVTPEPTRKRGRPSATAKKGSEKEEPTKEESTSAPRSSRRRNESSTSSLLTPRSPKKEKDDVNYLLPAERNKPSREDRKLLAQVAQIEASLKKKQEPKIEKRKGRSSTVLPKSAKKTATPEKKPKSEVKEEETSPTKEIRESARKKKRDAEATHAQSSTSTPLSVQPPRKRWAAASQEQMKEAAAPPPVTPTPSSTTPYSGKKQWLRRHAAESVKEESKAAASPSVTIPPLKKRRHMREAGESDDIKRDEAASVLAGMGYSQREGAISPELQKQMLESALKVNIQLGPQYYELPAMSPTGIVLPSTHDRIRSPVMSPVVSERGPLISQSQVKEDEPAPMPQKVGKRLSIEDYKKRRGAPAAATTVVPDVKVEELRTSPRKAGFIPELNKGTEVHLSNFAPPIESAPLGSPKAVDVDVLKKEFYGENKATTAMGSNIPPPPPPPRIQSPQGGDVSTDDEGAPKMSLAERLATEFGIVVTGTPSPQRGIVPPVGQLPVCPPPVTRRDLNDTPSTSTASSHPHRSRW